MVTTHAYPNSREAVLPVWTGEAQARRQAPDASLTALFVHIHGMLFTKIQLDDFKPKRLEDAITVVGTCRDMCSRAERYRRENEMLLVTDIENVRRVPLYLHLH